MARFCFENVRLSLADVVGRDYVEAVVAARCGLTGEDAVALTRLATEKVDFYPRKLQRALADMLPKVGTALSRPWRTKVAGASTKAFNAASHLQMAPLSGLGYYRVGADGRLYLLCKSEHYHAPLGHSFPGYGLVDRARRLGIGNATHNNTRGEITRQLEQELVLAAGGLERGDRAGLGRVMRSGRRGVLNRVLNLETGSVAVEAGLKMMLARFYRVQAGYPEPVYAGREPVFVVVGDEDGGLAANYHGTAVVAQMLRGMWPEVASAMGQRGLMRIAPVRPNDLRGLEAVFTRHEKSPRKIAGLCYEPVLMNYGGRRLDKRFVRRMHELCRKHDVPTLVDEIQTGLWHMDLFMFRGYGVKPTFVVIGKGFPGGEYPASRIVFSADMDCLPQFGALVTNGQEELASLAYLVTMRWAQANRGATGEVGRRYQQALSELAHRHRRCVVGVEGDGHLAGLTFAELAPAKAFVASLAAGGLDISVQTYKQICRPTALTKLPLIAGPEVVDMVVGRMDAALRQL